MPTCTVGYPSCDLTTNRYFCPGDAIRAAQNGGGINEEYIQGYADDFIDIVNDILLPVLIALAFIVFLWGVVNYFILGADSDEKRATGRIFVLWGIIAFVVIFSLWGLVAIVGSTFGLEDGGGGPTPQAPTFDPQ